MPFDLCAIGHIRSSLRTLEDAPRQGGEGAPDAWLEIDPTYAAGLRTLAAGDAVLVITWLHRADRAVLEVHPRGDPHNPLSGVFATRSPHRPNPLGLHRVTVREIDGALAHRPDRGDRRHAGGGRQNRLGRRGRGVAPHA